MLELPAQRENQGEAGAFVRFAVHCDAAVVKFDDPFGDGQTQAAALGSAATAVGDLSESVVKRDLGVKDMGEMLPGHGGILDRMDGILFALPTGYYVALVTL